jgi:hypothetical protein
VIPSTGDEHYSNREAQKKKRDISELGQVRKDDEQIYSQAGFVASTTAHRQEFASLACGYIMKENSTDDVERGERSVTSGDVLLQAELVRID